MLRWAADEGRRAHAAIAASTDAAPRFIKHGDGARAGRDELRSWPVTVMSEPYYTENDRAVLHMLRRRDRALGAKVRDAMRDNPLSLPIKAARYARWRWGQRRGQGL